ncbi:hypothetical protein BH11MYX1_BH11MYX1_51540 [soil metagenome]
MIRALVILAALGCHSHDQDHAASVTIDDPVHPVVLHLTPTSIEIDGKTGKHTFELESEKPSAELVRPVVDKILEAGGTQGITVWGRYAAPDVWNALAPAFSEVPTTICLRDGANC